MEIINATDGYKLGHHRMYPEGTEQVYSNWTPRSNKYFPLEERLIVIIRPLLLLMIYVMLEEHSLENLKFLKKDILMLSTRLWFVML